MIEPFLSDPDFTLYVGDVRDVLRELPAASVDCVVTSPPYWGLRDYGTGSWVGGDPGCDHLAPPGGGTAATGLMRDGRSEEARTGNAERVVADRVQQYRDVCGKCGAQRADRQIGLEATPQEYVATIVEVFREARRVLAPHGTVWLNLGDSYANDTKWGGSSGGKHVTALHGQTGIGRQKSMTGLKSKDLVGIPWRTAFALQDDGWYLRSDIIWAKPNAMPESVTDRPTKAHEFFFLLAKGEWQGPPKPLPHVSDEDARWLALLLDTEGNVVLKPDTFAAQIAVGSTHRPLLERARGIVGLGTVLERAGTNAPMYYWQLSDRQASAFLRRVYPYLIVKQHQARVALHAAELRASRGRKRPGGERDPSDTNVLRRCWETIKTLNHFGTPDLSWVSEPRYGKWGHSRYYFDQEAVREPHSPDGRKKTIHDHATDNSHANYDNVGRGNERWPNGGRNIRSVWTITTQSYQEAHFATFPEELPRRAILAGCPEWVCRTCGKPRERIVERDGESVAERQARATREYRTMPRSDGGALQHNGAELTPHGGKPSVTTGWTDCGHNDYRPGVVLDPFIGSGTTAYVARNHGRHAVGVELNPEYAALIGKRTQQQSLLS